MKKPILTMKLLKGTYGVWRFDKDEPVPSWASKGAFVSITRTEDELSIVAEMTEEAQGPICEGDWKVLKIIGPLDFALVGILSKISGILADCGVSIFAISTYDTDYILVKSQDLDTAVQNLKEAGYGIK